MRGSRLASALPRTSAGIIPAHAGLTRPTAALAVAHRDHPRACGAHVRPILSLNSRWGSSPRMRGSQVVVPLDGAGCGIIPAHAGLTITSAGRTRWTRDHPRACGAHPCPVRSRFFYPGSSPRMRGSQLLHSLLYSSSGIIPAHAGLTFHDLHVSCSSRDHPRACGAHADQAWRPRQDEGSSPRMRGSHALHPRYSIGGGIIPAHAGLTLTKVARILDLRDHPRACGAHAESRAVKPVKSGSSPRMRGSRPEPDPARRERGIIPAHAGLTRVARCWPFGARDHPRACGAHSACCSPCIAGRGSSPRMRGSRYHFVSLPCWTGIIPAHAGLTAASVLNRQPIRDHPRACGAH